MKIHLALCIFTLATLQTSPDLTPLSGDEESNQVGGEELSVPADESEATEKKKSASLLSIAMKNWGWDTVVDRPFVTATDIESSSTP